MIKKNYNLRLLLTTMLFVLLQAVFAQDADYSLSYVPMDRESDNVYFKAKTIVPETLDKSLSGILEYEKSELINNTFLRIVQFRAIPDNNMKHTLAQKGVELIDYVPNRAFIARITAGISVETLISSGIERMTKLSASLKTDKFIAESKFPEYVRSGNKLRLLAQTYDFVDFDVFTNAIEGTGNAEITNTNESLKSVEMLIAEKDILNLAASQLVRYIEIGHDEGEPENFTARTLHRSNTINTSYVGGKKYDGSGVVIMMQDDGDIGPHVDFNGRVDQSGANLTGSSGDHGDHVAGTFMGAGNIDPTAEGMAPGAFGYIYGNFNSNYNFVPGLYQNNNLVMTTKSYSNGCNAGYTSLTQQLDAQTVSNPALSHVFSAGNSGTSNCGYGAGSFWGNVTGGHKIGKNVIAVANLNATDGIATSSSRGPASDGRIKPDISAKGSSVYSTIENFQYGFKSGTSMACPGVTGTMAQLYHAFKDHNNGQDPNSALLKAIVLNTAEDLGNPGPDFIYGWGRINANAAYDVIENVQYQDSSISTGAVNNHQVTIPSGATRVKIMLYWKDPAPASVSGFALVNDLDLRVISGSLGFFDPLVLDPTPNPTTLNQPAVPGTDVLNNMEQVVIDNPGAGTYTMRITGTSVPQGPQDYFLVYDFEYDSVELTYPIGGESMVPGENQLIRWDAFGETGNFILEYSTDSGSTWNTIANNVSGALRYFSWNVPNTVTDKAMVRISRGLVGDVSEAPFTILGVPSALSVQSSCSDSASLTWNSVSGADGYILYKLGPEYMDSVTFTTSNSAYVTGVSSNDPDVWLSVQAVMMNTAGTTITGYGRRAIAIRKTTGIFNCPSEPPVAAFSADTTSICVGKVIKFINETENGVGTFLWTVTPASHAFVNGTNANSPDPEIQFNTNDSYTVKLEAFNPGGNDSHEKQGFVNPFQPDPVMNETFEGGLTIPSGWTTETSGGQFQWSIFQVSNGASGTSSRAAFFNRFGDIRLNEEDGLLAKPVDISGYNNPALIFDIATTYQQFTPLNLAGGLRIDVSEDCGFSFAPSTYFKQGDDLRTTGYTNSLYLPASTADWRSDTLDLSGYNGSQLQIKFVNISGVFGNSLYIDNVRLIENTNVGLEASNEIDARIYPNPAQDHIFIESSNIGKGDYELVLISSKGQIVKRIRDFNAENTLRKEVSLSGISSGLYSIKIIGTKGVAIQKISISSNK